MMRIVHVLREDLPEILALQHLAFRSEAEMLGCETIPPLMQTLADLEAEFDAGTILKTVSNDGALVGSVRSSLDGGTLRIGKLMVHPDYRGKGYGRQLLAAMEELCPCERFELFTSTASMKNLQLYRRMGYEPFREEALMPGVRLVHLFKVRKDKPDRG